MAKPREVKISQIYSITKGYQLTQVRFLTEHSLGEIQLSDKYPRMWGCAQAFGKLVLVSQYYTEFDMRLYLLRQLQKFSNIKTMEELNSLFDEYQLREL